MKNLPINVHHFDNSRRKFLANSLGLLAFSGLAASTHAGDKKHKHHSGGDSHAHHAHTNPHSDLIQSAFECVSTGEACRDHCIQLIKAGDNRIVECLDKVNELIPVCATLAKLASYESAHLSAYAKVAMAICKDCEKECAKHKDMHVQCRECM